MSRLLFASALMLAACSPSPAPRDAAGHAGINGLWNATFSLEHSPAASINAARAPELRGTIALLTNYGTYDVDFTPFGFNPRDANDAPALVVNPSAGDSVDLELADSRRETVVVLRGARSGDSISGAWVVYVGRDAGGRGRFLLRRR